MVPADANMVEQPGPLALAQRIDEAVITNTALADAASHNIRHRSHDARTVRVQRLARSAVGRASALLAGERLRHGYGRRRQLRHHQPAPAVAQLKQPLHAPAHAECLALPHRSRVRQRPNTDTHAFDLQARGHERPQLPYERVSRRIRSQQLQRSFAPGAPTT